MTFPKAFDHLFSSFFQNNHINKSIVFSVMQEFYHNHAIFWNIIFCCKTISFEWQLVFSNY